MRNGSAPITVAIDTNIFISALITRQGVAYRVVALVRHGVVRLAWSREQRDELRGVVRRPGLLRQFRTSPDGVAALLDELDETASLMPPSPSPIPVRDPKDEAILAAAIAGRADYLVTGDADLLVLADDPALGDLRIVTPAAFLAALDAE